MTENQTTATGKPANLRETKREAAAARKAAATKAAPKATTTKAAPAKAAAAKTAAAKAPAKKSPATGQAPTKLRWVLTGERDAGGVKGVEATATAGDREYATTRSGDAWKATVKQGGKTTVLVDGVGYGKAYTAITVHNKAASTTAQPAA